MATVLDPREVMCTLILLHMVLLHSYLETTAHLFTVKFGLHMYLQKEALHTANFGDLTYLLSRTTSWTCMHSKVGYCEQHQ